MATMRALTLSSAAWREAARLGATRTDLDDLMAQCDVVSLHAPLLPSTHHLVDAARLALLPDGADWLPAVGVGALAALVAGAVVVGVSLAGDRSALLGVLRRGPASDPASSPDGAPRPADPARDDASS